MPKRRSKRLMRNSDNDADTESVFSDNTNPVPINDQGISRQTETTTVTSNETSAHNVSFDTPPKRTENLEVSQKNARMSISSVEKESPICRSMITVGSVTPRNFDGREDVDDWIEHFIHVAKCNNWNEDMQIRRIPIYLKDTAELWFRDFMRISQSDNSCSSITLQEIFDGMRSALRPKNFRSINQSALICRLQGLNEPVATYHYDVLRLCYKMNPNMSEEDKLTHVMRGLKSGMLEKVLVLEPKDCSDLLNKLRSIEEAEFLSNQRPGYNFLLVRENKEKELSSASKLPIKPVEESEVDKLCKLVKDLLTSRKEAFNPSLNRNYNPNYRSTPFPRYSRTVDGRPICFNCNTPGHTINSCPRPRRDPNRDFKRKVEKPNGAPDQGNP